MSNIEAGLPIDTVEIWITPAIARDHIARGVFPQLRAETALELRCTGNALHRMSLQRAIELQADARQRHDEVDVQPGLKTAYTGFSWKLRKQIDQTQERIDGATIRQVASLDRHPWADVWKGTRQQLVAAGFAIDGPLPGEPGYVLYALIAKDPRGRQARITQSWAGYYQAIVDNPSWKREVADCREKEAAVRRLEKRLRTARQDEGLQAFLSRLRDLPIDPDEGMQHAKDA